MPLTLSNPLLHLRPITTGDEALLCRIYSSTRTEELEKITWWTPVQKETFLRSQFEAQHSYYQKNYTGAAFWVVECEAETIGRLYLHPAYEKASVRIIDITLLPRWRNKGIGRQILQDVMKFAASQRRTVTIHVESFNPAMKLYQKLGFTLLSKTNEVYHLLQWKKKEAVLPCQKQ
jgi:RimJ/RimL family protein N-acetyltransferase